MSEQPINPTEFGTYGLCPHIVCRGAGDAMDWYAKAFGAVELVRLPGPDGRLMHGSMMVNGCMLMIADEFRDVGPDHQNAAPPTLGGTPVMLHLNVTDCDAWTAKAHAAGATIVMPMADMFWGDRYGMIEDPFGHRWSIATSKEPPVTGDALTQAMHAAIEGV
jgi:PhnB protein